jgi:hypothetical protein
MISIEEYIRMKNQFKAKWKDLIWIDDTPKEKGIEFFEDRLEMCKLEIEICRYILEGSKVSKVPFTISDQIWLWGKYKGIKICETPGSYLKWALKTMDLTLMQSKILKETLEEISL